MASDHRPDIDGLRAVAILAVIGFHAGVPGFDGGFVGVDVFFAISGFLITRNLLGERAAAGRISYRTFVGRRLRRLAPAMALMLVVTLVASLFVLSPIEWDDAAHDAAASAVYVSNLTFAQRATDYFADGAPSLYLHTWSLSVEEQFYLVWPLAIAAVLWLGSRRRREPGRLLAPALGAAAAASLGLSVFLTGRGTPWAFFGLPTRAWQFALGGLLAWWRPSGWRTGASSSLVAVAGLAAIAAATFTYDDLTPYPGWQALVPTVGTLALILAAPQVGLLARGLANRTVQAIGRTSYSWYLWHWPVMLLAVAATGADRLPVRLAAMAASYGIAVASYRLVEQPVRLHRGLVASPARSIAVGVACALVALAAAGAVVARSDAVRAEPFYASLDRAAADRGYLDRCRATDPASPWPAPVCALGPADAAQRIVVLGDSHAQAWIPGLDEAARATGIEVLVRALGGCPSVPVDVAKQGARDSSQACERYRAESRRFVQAVEPDAVVMANASFLGRILTGGEVGSVEAQAGAWRDALADELAWFGSTGTALGVILPGPGFELDPVSCAGRHGAIAPCTPSAAEALEVSEPIREVSASAAEDAAALTYDPVPRTCDRERCLLVLDDTFLYLDRTHLTATASAGFGPELAAFLASTIGLEGR